MNLNKFLRKYWFVVVAIVVLALFFYPKSCGYTYGGLVASGMVLHREECSCFGHKYASVSPPLEQLYSIITSREVSCMDCGSYYFCAGIPYEKKCYEWIAGTPHSSEKEISCNWQFNYCVDDSNCIPAQCCHPTSCINKNSAPNCQDVACTLECRGGTMDCGAGHCACVNNKCQAVFTGYWELT